MDLGLHVIVLGQFHVDAGLAVALVLDLGQELGDLLKLGMSRISSLLQKLL